MQDAQRVKSCLLFKQEAKKESEEIRLLFFSEEYFNFVIQNLGNDGRGDDKLSESNNGCIDQFIFFDSPSQPEIINDYINCMNPLAKSHPLKLLIFLTDFEEEVFNSFIISETSCQQKKFTTKTAISDIPRVALSKKVVFDLTDKVYKMHSLSQAAYRAYISEYASRFRQRYEKQSNIQLSAVNKSKKEKLKQELKKDRNQKENIKIIQFPAPSELNLLQISHSFGIEFPPRISVTQIQQIKIEQEEDKEEENIDISPEIINRKVKRKRDESQDTNQQHKINKKENNEQNNMKKQQEAGIKDENDYDFDNKQNKKEKRPDGKSIKRKRRRLD